RRVDATARDAARLAGVGGPRAWRSLVRPVVRPQVARAVATVFVVALAEPGGPLALGLRRTAGFQIVEAARDPNTFPRAAALGLVTLALALGGWVIIRWWGGAAPLARDLPSGQRPEAAS